MINIEELKKEIFLTEEEMEKEFWFQDDTHLPHALSPLYASIALPTMAAGYRRTYEKMSFPLVGIGSKLSTLNSRMYQTIYPYEGDMNERIERYIKWNEAIFPRLKVVFYDYVNNDLIPFYNKLDNYIKANLNLTEAYEKIIEIYNFYIKAYDIHNEVVLPLAALGVEVEKVYGQLTGKSDTTIIYEMLANSMNKTLTTNRELWILSKKVKESPYIMDIFRSKPIEDISGELIKTKEGIYFWESLQSFLNQYGYRANISQEFINEIWIEKPELVLSIIVEYLKIDYDFDKEFNSSQIDKESKYKELLSSVEESELKEQFIKKVKWLTEASCIDADHHFYIDAMLPAKTRIFLLKVGALFVKEGIINKRDDIFFVYFHELLSLLQEPIDYNSIIEERKKEYKENKDKKPQAFYGVPPREMPEDPMVERIFGLRLPNFNRKERKIAGYAASQGKYKGKVKIVKSPDDFNKIEKGDILVSPSTSPPWTILFPIIGALVTDAGGILTHSGTVAREYKLPAVVGTKIATSILKDGDIITVDGTNGVVCIEE